MIETEPRPSTAFVIGPIGDKDAAPGSPERLAYEDAIQVWEEVILPASEAFGLQTSRADKIARPGEIPDQIFRLLRDADVVIADLTGANANVMYELGLRHTTGKLTLQIGERGRLPFDVAAIRTILFKRSDAGLVEARKKLSTAIAAALRDGGDPVSATRIWFESKALTVARPRELAEGEDETDRNGETEEEDGFLEKLADMEQGIEAISPILGTIVAVTSEINESVADATGETSTLNTRGGTASLKLQVANRLAARLADPASRLEIGVGEYAQSLRRIDPGMTYLLQRLAEEPDQAAGATEFLQTIRSLVDSASGTLDATVQFRDVMKSGGNAARSLRRATHRIASALQAYIDTTQVLMGWRSLLDAIPASGPTQVV